MDKPWRGRIVFTLQTTSITKYSRIYGQVHPSRSTHEFKSKLSIHHEVSQPSPCIKKYSRFYQAVHPSRSTHEFLLLFVVVVSGCIQTLATGGFKIAPHSSTHAMTANHTRQKKNRSGPLLMEASQLARPTCFLPQRRGD